MKITRLCKTKGYTIVELFFTMAVFALIAGLAVPSFTEFIRNNNLAAGTNDFLSAINLAKSEAVTRNQRVLICKRTSADACATGGAGTWQDGWVVFVDSDRDNALDAGEEIRFFDELNAAQTLTSGSTFDLIAFGSDGRLIELSGVDNAPSTGFNMSLCPEDGNTTKARSLAFNAAGKISATVGVGSCP